MACLALISASNLRAAPSTFPNNKSKPCEHWPARCMQPGVGPWPLPCQKNTINCCLEDKKKIIAEKKAVQISHVQHATGLSDPLSGRSFVPVPLQSPGCLSSLFQHTALPLCQLHPESHAGQPRQGPLQGRDTRQDRIVDGKKKIVESDVFSRVKQKIQLPGCPWGSFNQLLAWPIFDSIKARDLFKASIS